MKSDKALGGSGLGLTICKEIVRAHGGTIWVDSSSRKGEYIYLHPAHCGIILHKGEGIMKDKSVLIVDDEKNIRLTLSQALEVLKVDTDTAGNGEEALAKLKEKGVWPYSFRPQDAGNGWHGSPAPGT